MPHVIVTKDQVKHIANLAQIPLKEGEEELFADLFTKTLDYIEILTKLDTSKTPETYQVTGLTNIYQKGTENRVTLTQEEALLNASETKNGLIATKGVFNRE